ncbi:unnamed protein product [Aphanomyces euteiches]|uniref:Transmembrane protein 230 n=1 Tax=Aphanomyces euteiches TaxID=100861 RepID=A0A6G0WPL0_9STRA|nr:hypothetical protein Ae201684_013029 [Aphanomyces euteiches]KAH9076864.1 hypothetical protein Ae201684P_010795 [Aphanomyces euteiches]KAH9138192.1 hypothetical protein AeRB84_017444 [Aphanomyces euteiches]
MMSAVVAPREALVKGDKSALCEEGNDDASTTVEIDLKDEKTTTSTTNSTTTKHEPMVSFEAWSVTSTWTKIKQAVENSQIPVRTAVAALSLLIVGIVLLVMGFISSVEGHGLSHVFLGVIAFIPGSYATFQLYGAYQGWRGYEFHNLPSYEIA